MTAADFLNGQVLLIDKPYGWTSFQAVKKIKYDLKKHLGIKKIKVGHAGTLDPLASGLLIVCTGKMTKNISEFQNQPKTYKAVFKLGATTPSYDLETKIDHTFPTDHITKELILETTKQFIGTIQQKPPVFSAIKHQGERLYEKARRGESVDIKSREVHIHTYNIDKINMPNIACTIQCSKGTYIRSLAHDFGKAMESGAHLIELRRTKIGEFDVANAITPDKFAALLQSSGNKNI